MSEATATTEHRVPWVSRAAFPLVKGGFYAFQLLLGYCVYRGWWWACVPLMLLVSHFMHAMLIAFHEASHSMLNRSRLANEKNGQLIGIISLTSFTLYRILHQSHHMHLATEKDVELWPYVHPDAPLWKRRLYAFLELSLGVFFTPFVFWRGFFMRGSSVRSPKMRRRVWLELWMIVVFWATLIAVVAYFNWWPWFLWNYALPGWIAGNLQSWRKYIEHVGVSGNTARGATRSIIADTWLGKLTSLTLLHEPLHGIHHIKSNLPHAELPLHTDWLSPDEQGDIAPYPNYRAAFWDLLRQLKDPRVGGQWKPSPEADGSLPDKEATAVGA